MKQHYRFPLVLLAAVCGVALCVQPGVAHADAERAESAPTSILQADLGLAILGIGYERVMSPSWSLRVTGQYNRTWYTDADLHAAAVEIRSFWFPMGHGPRGLYVAPFARVALVRAQSETVDPTTGPGWTAGVSAGYGFRLGRRLLLRLGAGFQYWDYEVDAEPENVGLKRPHIGLDLMLGYAW